LSDEKASEMMLFRWLATNHPKNFCGQHIERENYGRTDIRVCCCCVVICVVCFV